MCRRLIDLLLKALIWIVAIGISQPALARHVSYVTPIRGISLLKPDYPPPPGGAPAYCDTDVRPLSWSVAQWSNPGGPLPPFKKLNQGTATIFETIGKCSRVKIGVQPQGSRLVLEQDGHLLPCLTARGGPREWDVFLQPNGPGVKPPRVSGLPLLASTNPSLKDLCGLHLEAFVTAWSGLANTRKHCKCNFANTNFSLVVTNTAKPGQTIFYQYVMSRLCGSKPDINLLPCTSQHKNLEASGNTNPLCVNDYPTLHGQDWLAQGVRTHVKVDVLPNLHKAISENKAGLDTNLAHWSIRTMYCGQAIYGDTAVKSAWENVSLTGSY